MTVRAALYLAAVGLGLACRTAPAPPFERMAPFHTAAAERVAALGASYEWYKQLEDCAHTRAQFSDIRWFKVATGGRAEFPCPGSLVLQCTEVWVPPNDLYVADVQYDEKAGWAIRHAMLHQIRQAGDTDVAFRACGLEGDGRDVAR